MYLKRLQLTGFKTFAEKTEILFSPGVTAIVGPNGSGKSNIADSVLWVLGEQKASAVRGVKNQDIIFNGTSKRKPTGLAEVSLTVDNSDHTLPLAFEEITITRRAHRSGDSEYLINKSPCRLKDIYELFLDTGVGREAYALVNQSEVDAVLSADPQMRRGLFEEAAGIKKYRVKKREALRKLETTESNLNRIRDILSEIDTQLAPLHVQAELARRYLVIKESLARVERDHLIVELRLADQQYCAALQVRQEEELLLARASEGLVSVEAQLALDHQILETAEAELDQCRERSQAANNTFERAESARRLGDERLAGLTAQSELAAREQRGLADRIARARAEITALRESVAQAKSDGGTQDKSLQETHDDLRRLNEQITHLQRAADLQKRHSESAARKLAVEMAELARAEARAAESQSTREIFIQEKEPLEHRHVNCIQVLASLEEAVETRQQDRVQTEAAASSARLARHNAQEADQKARAERDSCRINELSLNVRRKGLQELEDAQEGYYSGVKAVKQAQKRHELTGQFTVVADSFRAPSGYEIAFEVALGSSLQDIIVETERQAEAAIELLKRTGRGRATFLPLSRMRAGRSDVRMGKGSALPGFIGAALDLIEFEPQFRPALDVLLGRVLICETLDCALQLSRTADGWSRIVTLAGELTSPNGSITGGSAQRRGSSLLERKSEIARLDSAIQDAQGTMRACDQMARTAAEELDIAQKTAADAEDNAGQARLNVSAASQETERARRDLQQANEQLQTHMRRIDSAHAAVASAQTRVAVCHRIVADLEESASGPMQQGDDPLPALLMQREQLAARATTEQISRATLAEKRSGIERSLKALELDLSQMEGDDTRRLAHQADADAEIANLAAEASSRIEMVEAARRAIDSSNKALEEASTIRMHAQQRVQDDTAKLRSLNEERAARLAASRKNELIEGRFDMQRAQVAARLLEEYDITAEYALSLENNPDMPADGPREVTRLRRDLRAMGDVNAGAAEEYDRLFERSQFLTTQKTDAEEAKAKILTAIREIDDSTHDVFLSTFDAVGKAFQSVFERLFGGGEADIKFTDPGDLLETGVDIFVQPPGKKRQNLMLLSGGERALTAVALLFAFLKVKPAPFCLLDEVDAPLDGANIERFADLLRDFGRETQFLVITHNPATMDAAGVWYGVTMQEPGISRVLSLQAPAERSESRSKSSRNISQNTQPFIDKENTVSV